MSGPLCESTRSGHSKLRIKLGLKPLELGKSDATVTAETNYEAHREDAKKKADAEELRLRLAKYELAGGAHRARAGLQTPNARSGPCRASHRSRPRTRLKP